MDCKKFEKMIPLFFAKGMDYFTLNQFYNHMKECPDCKEELTIRFLVTEGIQRLEEGAAFDLQKELEQHLAEAERKLKRHNRFLRLGEILEFILILVIAAAIVWVII